jgi:hypothetical protein
MEILDASEEEVHVFLDEASVVFPGRSRPMSSSLPGTSDCDRETCLPDSSTNIQERVNCNSRALQGLPARALAFSLTNDRDQCGTEAKS